MKIIVSGAARAMGSQVIKAFPNSEHKLISIGKTSDGWKVGQAIQVC